VLPLAIACLALPACALLQVQGGIARAHSWMNLAQLPAYVFRQLLIIGGIGGIFLLAASASAIDATLISVAAVWVVALAQLLVLNRRLRRDVRAGARAAPVRAWLTASAPMLVLDGFYLLLTASSIMLLHLFQTPREVAVYYAAEKTLALVVFVHFAVAQSTAHTFSGHHVAGDRTRLAAALDHAVKLTFWPSLAATIAVLGAGIPLLWLFGPGFTDGYPLMFILAVGMLARSAVGPLSSFLTMTGQPRICAAIAAAALALNVALGLVLIPWLGTVGAALSISAAMLMESAALYAVTWRRLGHRAGIGGAAAAERQA
jgi:O-antigen/teichoic acid export membrane protein